jgi:hypothetical protein
VFVGVVTDPPVPGGCPLLSAAAESDYGASPVREQVRETMDELRELVRAVVAAGIRRGEASPETDPDDVAIIVVAAAEGGILLSQLYEDAGYVYQVAAHLHDYIDARLVKGDAVRGTDDRNGDAPADGAVGGPIGGGCVAANHGRPAVPEGDRQR